MSITVSPEQFRSLADCLLDNSGKTPLHERFRALFTLKAVASEEAVQTIASGMLSRCLHRRRGAKADRHYFSVPLQVSPTLPLFSSMNSPMSSVKSAVHPLFPILKPSSSMSTTSREKWYDMKPRKHSAP